MKKNAQHGSRVNSDVQRVLSHIISFDLKDPGISPITSVVKCEVTKDLSECKCYISVFGEHPSGEETLAALNRAKGFVRKRLAEVLNLRNTPEIHFELDTSIAYGVEMTAKIDRIIREEGGADGN